MISVVLFGDLRCTVSINDMIKKSDIDYKKKTTYSKYIKETNWKLHLHIAQFHLQVHGEWSYETDCAWPQGHLHTHVYVCKNRK